VSCFEQQMTSIELQGSPNISWISSKQW